MSMANYLGYTYAERQELIAACREACRHNVLRTEDEAREVRERAAEACRKLGVEFPEDAISKYA
jgi:hypothetical protein